MGRAGSEPAGIPEGVHDRRRRGPDFFACFNPNHRILSQRFFKKYLTFLAPQKRPMDNMAAGWDRPQEDEFALCMLAQPLQAVDERQGKRRGEKLVGHRVEPLEAVAQGLDTTLSVASPDGGDTPQPFCVAVHSAE